LKAHLLFIDTEATGLPDKWDKPYSAVNNWPSALQVSWIICDREGNEIKCEDHYINNNDRKISRAAYKINGLTADFLQQHGKDRTGVFALLAADIQQYDPVIIGHFIELDQKVLGADAFRAGSESPLEHSPLYCTMRATRHLVQNPCKKYLTLGELYELLLHQPLSGQHNALNDARATADCFFELVARKEINEASIEYQDAHEQVNPSVVFKERFGQLW
jgi:DNA polymerase III subunit epsilon